MSKKKLPKLEKVLWHQTGHETHRKHQLEHQLRLFQAARHAPQGEEVAGHQRKLHAPVPEKDPSPQVEGKVPVVGQQVGVGQRVDLHHGGQAEPGQQAGQLVSARDGADEVGQVGQREGGAEAGKKGGKVEELGQVHHGHVGRP